MSATLYCKDCKHFMGGAGLCGRRVIDDPVMGPETAIDWAFMERNPERYYTPETARYACGSEGRFWQKRRWWQL